MAERHSTPPRTWSDVDQQLRKTVQTVAELQKGLSNNWQAVLLEEDETETEVVVDYATNQMIVVYSAQDATTAAEIAAGTLWAEVSEGKVVIHHGAASGDRTLGVVLFG